MRILLTGSSGFIGRHLRESLELSHTVNAPSHAELDVTDANAVDAAVSKGRFDAVVHSAVQGGAAVLESTLRGFWNLARNASRMDRLIYFGSGAEFGKHRDLHKVGESQLGDEVPRDAYGLAKLLCTELARRSERILNLRLFGVFGLHEGYASKFISNTVAKALLGLPIVIRQDVLFDYLWVEDLVPVVSRFLEGDLEVPDVNVTPTHSISLSEIAEIVLRETGRPEDFSVEAPGQNFEYTGDNSRLRRLCPRLTFTPMELGIKRLLGYYRERIETVDREVLALDEYRRRCRIRRTASAEWET